MTSEFHFFTGVPGSRWSGIAQEIKENPAYDTSDRSEHRRYSHPAKDFRMHIDAYFGTGMEFDCSLDRKNLLAPFSGSGTKLLLSHEWPYHFDAILDAYPLSPITLIYRPDEPSLDWWLYSGGFDIFYPNYEWYVDEAGMRAKIAEQNQLILDFAQKHSVQWLQHHKHSDVFIGTYNTNVSQ